jgi:HPt (histidine-containing phosphotransfer) domain-containing protein
MIPLVEQFVKVLPERVRDLDTASRNGDRATLARIAHQLKGAAGGYGFPSVTESAARLESAARSNDVEIAAPLDDLVKLCRRATVARS